LQTRFQLVAAVAQRCAAAEIGRLIEAGWIAIVDDRPRDLSRLGLGQTIGTTSRSRSPRRNAVSAGDEEFVPRPLGKTANGQQLGFSRDRGIAGHR